MKNLSYLSIIVLYCLLAVSCMNEQQRVEAIAKRLNKQCPIALDGGVGSV